MFSYFRRRALIAGVAAEIKAQCKSQDLVNQVCLTDYGMKVIVALGEEHFTEKGKLRYFMIASFLLADTLRTDGVALDTKSACLEMLHDRRAKIEAHMDGAAPVSISPRDVGELDKITDMGIQIFHSERREKMMSDIQKATGMDL